MDAKTKARPEGRGQWWVRKAHDEIEVVRSAEKPDGKPGSDDRLVTIVGPFHDETAARNYAQKREARTLRAIIGKGR